MCVSWPVNEVFSRYSWGYVPKIFKCELQNREQKVYVLLTNRCLFPRKYDVNGQNADS